MEDPLDASHKIAGFLDGVIRASGFRLTWTMQHDLDIAGDVACVYFQGADTGLLLAENSELLAALEHVAAEVLHLSPNTRRLLRFSVVEPRTTLADRPLYEPLAGTSNILLVADELIA